MIKESDLLNLPEAKDFISEPPEIGQEQLIHLCEKMLPVWNELRFSKLIPPFQGEAFRLLE